MGIRGDNSFIFEWFNDFYPDIEEGKKVHYAQLHLSILAKPGFMELTHAEKGFLLDIVIHVTSIGHSYVKDWTQIGHSSDRDRTQLRHKWILKFERLGIVSSLTHRQVSKEERKEGRKCAPVSLSSRESLSTTSSLSPNTLPLIEGPSPKLGIAPGVAQAKRSRQILEVLENFEKYTQRKRGPTETNKKLIGVLLDSGYSVEDIILVIRDRNLAWREDLKMCDYIEPKTIFRKSNFEGYLDKARDAKSDVSVQMRIDAGNLENQKILEQREAELEAKRNVSDQQREINRQKILEADIGFNADFFKRVKENVGRGTDSATPVGRELGTSDGGNNNNGTGELQAQESSGSHRRDDETKISSGDREVHGLQEPGGTLPTS